MPKLRVMHRNEGDWLICESPTGNTIAVPAWMADPPSARHSLSERLWSRCLLSENYGCSLTLYIALRCAIRHPGVLPQGGVRMKQNRTAKQKQIMLLLATEVTGDMVLSDLPMARVAELIRVLSDLLLSAARGDANLQGGNDAIE